ncbi:MAG TPA: UDP-N-acetylmuramoyl-tripeptide--D-alanyl-D-alanine ligase [Solirubrobacteraceae bacterium]|nr:UDP-N-acetylmuramoyl-tripeptide--D-alanyl-D-alanine ligase [Solirubrobacteraceae bacterium]
MRDWSPEQVATAAGARLLAPAPADPRRPPGPERVTIDSRDVRAGDLFVGLPGTRVDGGRFARAALDAGAWGVLVAREHAPGAGPGVVIAADEPLTALGALARSWRRALRAQVVGITGSTGKTSTKDLLAAMLAQDRRVAASWENFNTEIGLPLTILGAPLGTEALVVEMAMRGPGEIAELTAIAEPDVGVIVNVGPVHLELLGSLEAIAAAKAELLAGLRPGASAVVPADEPLLDAHLRDDLQIVTFGPGGDVGDLGDVELPFTSAHMRLNALAALAAARALGADPRGRLEVALSAMRGQRIELPGPVLVIDDCYNANPMSMRAALDDLAASAATSGAGRRVAVLGDMLELGPDQSRFHAEIGAHAASSGVDVLVTVGPLAARMAETFGGEVHAARDAAEAAALTRELLRPGDTVLVKGSRGVGLEVVAQGLQAEPAG